MMKKYIILFLIVAGALSISSYISSKSNKEILFTSSLPAEPTPFKPEPDTPITMAELSKHNNSHDCWVGIMGSVYDVTRFIDMHPGKDGILKGCGIDASAIFNSEDNHGTEQRRYLKGFKIGILVDEKVDNKNE